MKKLLTILAVAMLVCGTAYAGTATGDNLNTPLRTSTTLKINVLGKFYLIVTPDLVTLELDAQSGQIQGDEAIRVTAGSGEAIDWYLKVDSTDFSNGAATPITFEPDGVKLIFYPAEDASRAPKGDVLNNFASNSPTQGAPLSNTATAVYKPKTAHKQAVHGTYAQVYGELPAVAAGAYNATLTFQMVSGVPA